MRDTQHKGNGISVSTEHALHDPEETAKMLRIAIAQIDTTMEEADDSIAQLVDSIMAISSNILEIENNTECFDDEHISASVGTSIRRHCEAAKKHSSSAITALQFYDRLTQRISHVHDCLNGLANLIQMKDHNDVTWEQLQEKVRSVYSFKQEQEIYTAFIGRETRGNSISGTNRQHKSMDHGEIDLF